MHIYHIADFESNIAAVAVSSISHHFIQTRPFQVQFGYQDVGALCAMLGADGACSSNGYVAGSGTGADGGGKAGNNAVRRHAGTGNATIRLPKSIAMFASRACRSSIMIGDSLTRSKMETILRTMQNLDHPWECAHGRPTIRHVRDLLEDVNKDLDL